MMYYYYREPSESSSSSSSDGSGSASTSSSSSGSRLAPIIFGYQPWPATSHVYHHHHTYTHAPPPLPPPPPAGGYYAYPQPECSWRGGSGAMYYAHAQTCAYPHYFAGPSVYTIYGTEARQPVPTPSPPETTAAAANVRVDQMSQTPNVGSAQSSSSETSAPSTTAQPTTPPPAPQPVHITPPAPPVVVPWADLPPDADFTLRPPDRQEARRSSEPEVIVVGDSHSEGEVSGVKSEPAVKSEPKVKLEPGLEAESPVAVKPEPKVQIEPGLEIELEEGPRVVPKREPMDTTGPRPEAKSEPESKSKSKSEAGIQTFPFSSALQRAIDEAAGESVVATVPRTPTKPTKQKSATAAATDGGPAPARLGIHLLEASVTSSSLRRALLAACEDDDLWRAVVSTAGREDGGDALGLAERILRLAEERSDLGRALLAAATNSPLGSEILSSAEQSHDIAEAVRRVVRKHAAPKDSGAEGAIVPAAPEPLTPNEEKVVLTPPARTPRTPRAPRTPGGFRRAPPPPLRSARLPTDEGWRSEPTPSHTVRFCLTPRRGCSSVPSSPHCVLDPRRARVDDTDSDVDDGCCACAHMRRVHAAHVGCFVRYEHHFQCGSPIVPSPEPL